MLFRDITGKMVELNRYDFKNDKLYYQQIINIKQQYFTKSNNININDNSMNYSNYIINNNLKETFNDKN
jgi:hypothetical protein